MRTASLFLALALSAIGHAQTITGSGGTLVAPTAVGLNITVSGVQLSGGGTASLSCPVTFFGAGTYQWNWQCDGGILTVDGHIVATYINGGMKLTCSGGGRYHPTTCWHQLSGSLAGGGTVSVTSKGGTNNAISTVTSFSASW